MSVGGMPTCQLHAHARVAASRSAARSSEPTGTSPPPVSSRHWPASERSSATGVARCASTQSVIVVTTRRVSSHIGTCPTRGRTRNSALGISRRKRAEQVASGRIRSSSAQAMSVGAATWSRSWTCARPARRLARTSLTTVQPSGSRLRSTASRWRDQLTVAHDVPQRELARAGPAA